MTLYDNKTNIHRLNAKNLDDFLNTPNKDVFLMICLTKSSRCKAARTRLIRVAKKLVRSQNIVFGQIDPSKNELAEMSYKNLPTFLLFPDMENRRDNIKEFIGKTKPKKKKIKSPETQPKETGLDITTANLLEFLKQNVKHTIADADIEKLDKEDTFTKNEAKNSCYVKRKEREEEPLLVNTRLTGGGIKRTFSRFHVRLEEEEAQAEEDEEKGSSGKGGDGNDGEGEEGVDMSDGEKVGRGGEVSGKYEEPEVSSHLDEEVVEEPHDPAEHENLNLELEDSKKDKNPDEKIEL